ncbi:sulfite exporter TauE/SafE family protein [Streptomyces sp. TRM49041]|uniref:TSUP family transporter n=1 Tax=Streptomyces sp. TRM49041 TaxID=2603216 RepID=UPI0011EF36D1|nr:sulfite exporter TauE/SafE family protein [Streptomyces sp. TRM49041]
MPDVLALVFAAVAVFLGSLVQGSMGVGLALVAAPVVQVADPGLMPGAVLLVAFVLSVLGAAREFGYADWHGVSWALAGRVAGTLAAACVISVVSGSVLDLLTAGITLAIVAVMTLDPARVPMNRATLIASGAAAGITGTTSSIGGPFLALVYHREPGPTTRGTLSVFFAVGTLLSLGALAAAGRLPHGQLVAGTLLMPAMAAGFWLSGPLRRHVEGERMRKGVLLIAVAAAGVLITRSLIGA